MGEIKFIKKNKSKRKNRNKEIKEGRKEGREQGILCIKDCMALHNSAAKCGAVEYNLI